MAINVWTQISILRSRYKVGELGNSYIHTKYLRSLRCLYLVLWVWRFFSICLQIYQSYYTISLEGYIRVKFIQVKLNVLIWSFSLVWLKLDVGVIEIKKKVLLFQHNMSKIKILRVRYVFRFNLKKWKRGLGSWAGFLFKSRRVKIWMSQRTDINVHCDIL